MFTFKHVYPKSVYKEGRKPRNVRTRFLGVVPRDRFLYLVIMTNKTEILLVDKECQSTTVLALGRYIEIVSADISSDFELLVYTERIPCGTKFKFKSVICHLHSFSDLKVFEDALPITSFFLPDSNGNFQLPDSSQITNSQPNLQNGPSRTDYQIIHIIDNRFIHLHVSFVNKKLEIKQSRMGCNLNNCRSFFCGINNNKSRLICAIGHNNVASFYSFSNSKYFFQSSKQITSYETLNLNKYTSLLQKIQPNEQKESSFFKSIFGQKENESQPMSSAKLMNVFSTLPPELALLPSVMANHPFFRFSRGNMFVLKLLSSKFSPSDLNEATNPSNANSIPTNTQFRDFAIIEQLYRGEEFPLAFSVTVLEQNYSRIYEVPNVQPDVPINFLSYESIVFCFVLNRFVSMIDFTTFPPAVYFLPRSMATGPFNEELNQIACDISVTTSNFNIDLESGEMYTIELSLKDTLSSMNLNFKDRRILQVLATLVSRLPNYVSISSILLKLPYDDICTIIYFFQLFFKIGLAMNVNEKRIKPPSSASQSQPIQAQPLISDQQSQASSSSSASRSDDTKNKMKPPEPPNKHKSHRSTRCGRTVRDLMDMTPPLSKENMMKLDDIDREFPSLGRFTRVDSFLFLLLQYRSLKVRDKETHILALHHLQLQNRLSLLLRAGIDDWNRVSEPNNSQKFLLSLSALYEAKKASAPSIPCLELEVEALSEMICPISIRTQLRCSGRLIGITGLAHIVRKQEKPKKKPKSSQSISDLNNLLSRKDSRRGSLQPQKFREMTQSTTNLSYSKLNQRGRKSTVYGQIPKSTPTRFLLISESMHSSNEYFKNYRQIVEDCPCITPTKKSLNPNNLIESLRLHEENESKYWSRRLPLDLKQNTFTDSANDASTLGTNSLVISKLYDNHPSKIHNNNSSDFL